MNLFNTIFLLAVTLLAVFWSAAFQGIRNIFGAQVDLLPALIVYASLRGSLGTVAMVALVGGLGFDSLSANPLGVSVLPLFIVGFLIHSQRELVLRDQTYAQLVLGLAASAIIPVCTLMFLLTTGRNPLIGWGTLWQLVVMAVGGMLATPCIFILFDWLRRLFMHQGGMSNSFRPDREIRRGR